MKILFFIHRFPGYGGIETVTTVIANFLYEQGYNVRIISFIQEDEELLEKLNKKITLYRFPNQHNTLSIENEDFFYSIISSFQPDTIINQESYAKTFDLLVKVKSKISSKIITVEHNSPDAIYKMLYNFLKHEKFEFNGKRVLKKLFQPVIIYHKLYKIRKDHRLFYKYSDEYILLSKKFIPVFKKTAGLKIIDKIKSIENPVTIKPQRIELKNKEKIVLYVGRLDNEHKQVDRLVKIWGKIFQIIPDWKFVIVGDGKDRILLEDLVNEKKILNIEFKGSQSNVIQYYSKASILCMTSNVEGWPLVLAEAMTYGCVPVLYNSFASASDIVENGINGILIEPFDEDLYVTALSELMINNDKREFMALQAIQDSTRFSLEVIGNKWIQLLKK